ncbi:sugar phosphate isomerase/epimerase family protein [Metabacillus malikii]|uniref:Sugar phosphate isomerase/epimerase n=1 Tax=Metabacillus malikii TaxID=1504265 RepID=A0ABT9ZDT9_9BACI|nr:sugar phosphate isomerase/epimerase [Metabacillus malikii]MDQ0230402.1 sugar phosphate isomerase/epimerase [Metabacillus malikii]
MKTQVAVQLFTLQNECERDFTGTLEKVASLGFNGVELAGYWGMEAKDLKTILEKLNLKAVSSHVPLERLLNNIEAELEYLKVLDCKHIVCPYLFEDERNDYAQLATQLDKIGELALQKGISLSYHNHDFELEKIDGKTKLERLFAETNPKLVKAELDVYWLTLAGEDPLAWIEKYTGRIPLIHLKDMTTDDEKAFAELGTGGVKINEIVNKCAGTGVEWFIIEQDKCKRSPFESITQSIQYLKGLM